MAAWSLSPTAVALPNAACIWGYCWPVAMPSSGARLDDPQAGDLQRQVLPVGELDSRSSVGSLNAFHHALVERRRAWRPAGRPVRPSPVERDLGLHVLRADRAAAEGQQKAEQAGGTGKGLRIACSGSSWVRTLATSSERRTPRSTGSAVGGSTSLGV